MVCLSLVLLTVVGQGQGHGRFVVQEMTSCCMEQTCACAGSELCSAEANPTKLPRVIGACGCGAPSELWVLLDGLRFVVLPTRIETVPPLRSRLVEARHAPGRSHTPSVELPPPRS